MSATQPINEAKLHEFMMKAVGEMGAAMNAALSHRRRQTGLVQSNGRRGADDVRRAGRQNENH